MRTITPGKQRAISAVADKKGVIRAAAMDQRGSLRKSIAKAKKMSSDEVTAEIMTEFKTAVVRILSPYASAVLLDPEYGLEAADSRQEGTGLLLAYEQSGYENNALGRMPILLPEWTVRLLVEAGANCIKVLLYYTPSEDNAINDRKKAWVERIGAECAHHDVPFFLEFVGYNPTGDAKGVEYARKKPGIVTDTIAEFSQDFYNVDVLKVEIPVDLQYTKGTRSFNGGEAAYSRDKAKELYRAAAEAARRPFIYLSAGVSNAQFLESIELALEADVPFAGVLCGRATWKDGIPVYAEKGRGALEEWLSTEGVKNIEALNQLLRNAHSWQDALQVVSK